MVCPSLHPNDSNAYTTLLSVSVACFPCEHARLRHTLPRRATALHKNCQNCKKTVACMQGQSSCDGDTSSAGRAAPWMGNHVPIHRTLEFRPIYSRGASTSKKNYKQRDCPSMRGNLPPRRSRIAPTSQFREYHGLISASGHVTEFTMHERCAQQAGGGQRTSSTFMMVVMDSTGSWLRCMRSRCGGRS